MNDEFKSLIQDIANALSTGGEALKTREITPDELLVLSKDLRALSRTTKYLAEVARLLDQ